MNVNCRQERQFRPCLHTGACSSLLSAIGTSVVLIYACCRLRAHLIIASDQIAFLLSRHKAIFPVAVSCTARLIFLRRKVFAFEMPDRHFEWSKIIMIHCRLQRLSSLSKTDPNSSHERPTSHEISCMNRIISASMSAPDRARRTADFRPTFIDDRAGRHARALPGIQPARVLLHLRARCAYMYRMYLCIYLSLVLMYMRKDKQK